MRGCVSYRQHGLRGLVPCKPGRGRKSMLFFLTPLKSPNPELLHDKCGRRFRSLINRHQTRWTTAHARIKSSHGLRDVSVPGIHQILSRVGISYKRSQKLCAESRCGLCSEKLILRTSIALDTARDMPETSALCFTNE